MTSRTLMVLDVDSDAGKSLTLTVLCRIFRQDGHSGTLLAPSQKLDVIY
jgi:cobyric acid synthase